MAWLASSLAVVIGMSPSAVLATSQTVDREIAALEERWNEAHRSGDADTLEELAADDLVVVVPGMPPMSKAESFGVLRAGRMKFQRYETSDTRIRVFDRAAVVTGRLERSRVMGDRTVEDRWRFTKVYVRGDGGWKVVSFHASDER